MPDICLQSLSVALVVADEEDGLGVSVADDIEEGTVCMEDGGTWLIRLTT